jgi:hypothetical protein
MRRRGLIGNATAAAGPPFVRSRQRRRARHRPVRVRRAEGWGMGLSTTAIRRIWALASDAFVCAHAMPPGRWARYPPAHTAVRHDPRGCGGHVQHEGGQGGRHRKEPRDLGRPP